MTQIQIIYKPLIVNVRMNKGKNISLLIPLTTIFLLSFGYVNAYPITAITNKIVYGVGDTLSITGTVNTTGSISITTIIYDNSTGSVVNTSTVTTSGNIPNTFHLENVINESYNPGEYVILITDGVDTINISIRVVPQLLTIEANPITSGDDVINVSTITLIQSNQALGGNFTELLSLSKTGKLHYGNYSIGGKTYHFVLVDQTNATIYDRVYIDDDIDFRLYNDTEDVEDIEYQALRKGNVFSNGTFKYVIGEIETATGNKLILFKPDVGKPPYSTTDTMNFIVVVKNNTHLLSGQSITVSIRNSTHNITPLTTYQTNEFGWFNASKSFTDVSLGFYTLDFNESLSVLPFPVEAFKLFVSTTDLSNTPTSTFAPNSKVRIIINSKNVTGPIDLENFNVTVYHPDSTISTKTKNSFEKLATGVYRYDLDLEGGTTGSYGISVVATDGRNVQTSSVGFEIQSVNFEVMAINPRYIEEAESSGAMVNAFPPNSNVSIMTFLSNITAGGMEAKGPEGFIGLLDPGDCNSSVTLTKLKDENGVSHIDSINYQVMNLSQAMDYLKGGDARSKLPPKQMLKQCMIIFHAPNKTGIYKAEVKINHRGEERYAGVIFGIQRLFARGATVDAKGEDFGFFTPNSTVRIKLKVRDLLTDEQLPGSNITSGKIIELYRIFPSFKDVLGNSTLRTKLNESIVNGTIVFTSPPDEGFYMMKFRFTADVAGNSETGIGDAFFMLKKYIIWGELAGAEEGQWYIAQGQNITLTVTVLDINKAKSLFGGYTNQKTCTGCGNFTVGVSEIRNEQQFKTVTGYSVQKGYITNSTNPITNITIIPSPDMQPGWYTVDLLVNDTGTGNTYFGWAGFEIRNFWVDTRKAMYNKTGDYFTFTEEFDRGSVYPAGSTVYFVILPRNATDPSQLLDPNEVSLESLLSLEGRPPVPITGYDTSITKKETKVCREKDNTQTCVSQGSRYIVNISNLPEEDGEYQANVKVKADSLSDIGTFWFSVSSYNVYVDYRMNSWPPLFSSTENLTVNFTAVDFDDNPYNITNVTVDEMFSEKKERPIMMRYGENYTTVCPEDNFCQCTVNLSFLPSGEYKIKFAVVDENGDEKIEQISFKIQDAVMSIASIEDAWIHEIDSVSKKISDDVRRGEWSWCQDERNDVPDRIKLCGDFCPPEQSCQQFTLLAPNVSYSKEIFGYIPMMEEWVARKFGNVTNKSKMWMYSNGTHLWINATPKIVGGDPLTRDLSETLPITVGGTFTDDKGGIWRLSEIGDQSITVSGINTLYKTGVLINTSYSKSGIIKLGQIREYDLGAFTPEGRAGIDLDGDGFTNNTVYFAIADNVYPGVYDTFFFSVNGNFTGNASPTVMNPISVNEPNIENRRFGFGNSLILLSIDPRAEELRFYSQHIGDWTHIGEIKWNNNITIPVIVASPDGTPRSADVSITGYKNTRTWKFTNKNLVVNQPVTGLGELKFNTSELGNTGEYSFAIEVDGEPIEEWKWPIATVRGFLVDGELGDALYITNLKPLDLRQYNWDTTNGNIIRIQSDRRNATKPIDGVLSSAFEISINDCSFSNVTHSDASDSINSEEIKILRDDADGPIIHFMYNTTNQKLYKNESFVCHFNISNLGTSYSEGDSFTINRYGRYYNVTVLTVDNDFVQDVLTSIDQVMFETNNTPYPLMHAPVVQILWVNNTTTNLPPNQYGWNGTHIWLTVNDSYSVQPYNVTYKYWNIVWRGDFGIPGVNASIIQPMVNNSVNNPMWGLEWGYMHNVSIFGNYYDVILANDTSYNYQRCLLESLEGCAKKAWIVPTDIGNFSAPQAKGVTIGQNFTAELYLASIGPHDGNGITVGNFSNLISMNLPKLPGIADIPLVDGTMSYFAVLNETAVGVDLDKNSSTNTQFYMLLFDSDFNGRQNLTSNIIDDDLEIVSWTSNIGGNDIQVDFTSNEKFEGANESWTTENWCDLPRGSYRGCARFGEEYPDRDYEEQPNWDIPFYNSTHLLLRKSKWKVNETDSVSVLLKIYDFDQSPIIGANISVVKISVAMPWIGFQNLIPGVNYTVDTTYNTTDTYGYALLKMIPNPTTTGRWVEGEYQTVIKIQTPQGTETWERWFCVGVCE